MVGRPMRRPRRTTSGSLPARARNSRLRGLHSSDLLVLVEQAQRRQSTVAIFCPDEIQYQVPELLDGLAINGNRQALRDLMQKKGRVPFLTFMNPEGRTTTQMSDIIALGFAAVGAAFSNFPVMLE